MTEHVTPIPEEVYARAVFAPLGGIVEVGAVNATGTWRLADVAIHDFLAHRRDDVERLFNDIRSVCRFSDCAMAVVDELGWFRDHEVSGALLLLWSAGVTGVPQPLSRLEEPPTVRRMCRMAADLQLTALLQALITTAVAAGTPASRGAPTIAGVLATACDLADPTGRSTPDVVLRMWRVAHLAGILSPGSDAPENGRAGFRAYDRTLEELITSAGSEQEESS
ncbi:hypothetical protein ACIQ6Y_31030 [Streptomyces sp. NPDC096205]|uniref:hypothetical protein n=1 Tax=Streptomyces sp. NPDC096205 TaxID=3366081 RepID=UPI003830D772